MTDYPSCPWCYPPRVPPHLDGSPVKVAFLVTDICPVHLEMSGIPEYERCHPLVGNERHCNETCGCCTLEELDERLVRRRSAAPAPPEGP